MLTKKNIIILHSNGRGMCALLRGGALSHMAQSFMTGEFEFISSPEPIRDEYILKHTVAVLVNRVWNEDHASIVRSYDRYRRRPGFGLKVFLDYDDLIWDLDGVHTTPDYNPAQIDTISAGKTIERTLGMVDGVFVSTPWLASCWKYRFGTEAKVVPNFLPMHLYGERRRKISRKIKKPVVLYGGSVFHFREGENGDFAGPWIHWLKESVEAGAIELHLFRPVPWMFRDVADKIVWHDPVHALMFPTTIRSIEPDIYIAPLLDNPFNRAKSDLKYSEACAIGAAFVGSWWKDACPYSSQHELCRVTENTTSEELAQKVAALCEPQNFNAVMEHQRKSLESRWLENRSATTYVMKALCGDWLQEG